MHLRKVMLVFAFVFAGVAAFGSLLMLSRPDLPSGIWLAVAQAAFFASLFGLSALRTTSGGPACICGRKLGELSFCAACGRNRTA